MMTKERVSLRIFRGLVRAVDGAGMQVNGPSEVYLRGPVDELIANLTAEREECQKKLIEAQQLAIRQGNRIRELMALGGISG